MKAVDFPERNILLAEDQPEYETLPIWMDVDENKQPVVVSSVNKDGEIIKEFRDPMGQTVYCMELSPEELAHANKTGKIWLVQSTFWQPFQPIRMSATNPFLCI